MKPINFRKYNIIVGWAVFLIAFITYSLTVEPTASFWDCAEYIATSAKLQIGHPPGAPFFQILGAFFAMFATSNENVALMVNYMSIISSALTVLFLFWSSTNILRKVVGKSGEKNQIVILGSAFVGALTLTFSDSFWFNAVEAEVYAMATFMMSIMLWMALRWIDEIHQPRGHRWLILISFVIGLSFGVHFMALLTIPTIGMIYFFKTEQHVTVKKFILANIISIAILLFIFKLLLPYTLAFFGNLEVFFVNTIGLPFNSGSFFAGIFIIGLFYWLLSFTRKKNYVYANTLTLCVLFIFIGFSTWIMLPIRSNANTVINENSPHDARALLAYYNLEQYPDTHLIYGPMFTDAYAGQNKKGAYKDDKPKYERDYKTGKYIIVNHWKNARVAANKKQMGILPRMWSTEHAENYINLTGPLDFEVNPKYRSNKELVQMAQKIKMDVNNGNLDTKRFLKFIDQFKEYLIIKKPSFFQNIYYLFAFQINYMYIRYFMWNFVGRQDDVGGALDNHGNWLSGIKFIDKAHLGLPQNNLPSDVVNNKARNTYYFLPLILGLIGLVFLFQKDKKRFWIMMTLFLFTGIALKIYLNERPFEPRERDYALVGSFFIFSMWVGFGVYALFEKLQQYLTPKILKPAIITLCVLSVPTVMAYQNWDDHDRSGRYTAQSMAKSYLNSVAKDKGAMLFTIGDNDTFALWYAQEIEDYRTDVKTINTSLLATDWYIDQMRRKTYKSEAIPSIFTHDKYAYGVRDVVYYQQRTDNRWNIKDFMKWIANDSDRTKLKFGNNQSITFYPTNKIRVPVNKENVLKSGIVKEKDSLLIVDYIDIDLPESILTKNRLLMLDILAQNDWKRPIYFTGGSFDSQEYIWMKEYLQLDGLTYKLVPIKTPIPKDNPYNLGRIDSDLMFDIISKWNWGNASSPDIYHDPETRKNSISYRSNISKLITELVKEKKIDKAKKAIDIIMTNIPFGYFGYYSILEDYISHYYKTKQPEKARELFENITQKHRENLDYYAQLAVRIQANYSSQIIAEVERYRNCVYHLEYDEDETFFDQEIERFNGYVDKFNYFYDESEKFEKE